MQLATYSLPFLLAFGLSAAWRSGWERPRPEPSFIQVSKRDPRYLAMSQGGTFIPIGPNICFPRFITDETEILTYYQHYFQKLAENGGNFTRIWLSVPVFEVEHAQVGTYDLVLAQRMEKILALAEKHQIKVKFCLEHFRKITNSPATFPGSVPFDRPVYAEKIKDMADFFNSATGKQMYLARVDFWAARFAQNPTVFGWELWNEIDAVPVPDDQLRLDWTMEMLLAVKKRFPQQLVMQSLGSFDQESKNEMYQQFSELPANQLAQVHRYLDEGAKLPLCQGAMDELASDAVYTLRGFSPDKPVILSEVGAVEPRHAGPWRLYPQDTLGVLLHDLLFAPFFAGAAAPGQTWHWDFYLDKNNLWWHFGRFKEAIKGFDPIAEKVQTSFEKQSDQLKIYVLRGKKTELMWIRDGSNNWKTELIQHEPVRVVNQAKLRLNCKKCRKISFYNPWKNVWQAGKLNPDHSVNLPEFSRSLILKIEK